MAKKWTKSQLRYLKKYYSIKTPKQISKAINRTVSSIRDKAEKLKLRSYRTWREEDINFLKKNYENASWDILIKKLHKNKSAISGYAHQFNLIRKCSPNAKWSDKEIKFLVKHYSTKSMKFLKKYLRRNACAITSIAYSRGLYKKDGPKRNTNYKLWQSSEIEYLKNNTDKDIYELTKILKRNPSAIVHKLERLGLLLKKVNFFEKGVLEMLRSIDPGVVQFPKIKYWRPDFLIAPNILIEANGAYWHADLRFYKKKDLNAMQKNAIKKDKRKKKALLKQGYRYFVIWEHDFYDNTEKLKRNLMVVLKSNLKEYDSAKTVNLPRIKQENTVLKKKSKHFFSV